ncbi:MAG: tetratricopeptide repeat protein [Phycisphaerae bacterium]
MKSPKRGQAADNPIDRKASRRKWLWALLFTANLGCFLAACGLWTYLTTGQWLQVGRESLRASLAAPLADTLAMPLPPVYHPWMMLVYSCLVALFVFVPIGATVAYRFVAALVFVLALAVLAQAAVLALAVLLGCVLVVLLRRRGAGPVPACGAGLILPSLLLGLLAYIGLDTAAVQPIQRWIPVSWLVFGSVLGIVCGLALATICRFVHIRRGVLLPLQLALLASAGWVYLDKVGTDELAYALLQRDLPGPETLLAPEPVAVWMRNHGVGSQDAQQLYPILQRHAEQVAGQLAARATPFLAEYPDSDHVPPVLWLLGHGHSLQPSQQALAEGQVQFTADYPDTASLPYWLRLIEQYPAHPQAHLARWRVGEIMLRQGRIAEGYDQLLLAQKQLEEVVTRLPGQQRSGTLFMARPPVPAPGLYQRGLQRVRWLTWMIHQNKLLESPADAAVFAAWLQLNPFSLNYRERLEQLLQADSVGSFQVDVSRSTVADNIQLALARTIRDPLARAEQLKVLSERLNDAAIGANYELGRLLVQDPALAGRVEGLQTARRYFTLIAREAIANPWQQAAEENLRWLAIEARDPAGT